MTDATGTVIERRAEFVYEAARLAAAGAGAPIVPEPWIVRDERFRAQFLDVIARQCGPSRSRSPEELHGAWVQAYVDMGWRYGIVRDVDAKTHPDMVPYDELGQLEQDKDAVFVALCEIARQWIRDDDAVTPPVRQSVQQVAAQMQPLTLTEDEARFLHDQVTARVRPA